MPSTSKSNPRKPKKPKCVSKQNQPTMNWLDLPSDVMANILNRIGGNDILENAKKVCTTWRNICKDPSMWKVIHIDCISYPYARHKLKQICKNLVNRSQGQLLDVTLVDCCDHELLKYITDRSSQLRRLEIACCYGDMNATLTQALKKFSLLEELSLHKIEISEEAIETAARYCPLLKVLKVNQQEPRFGDEDSDELSLTNCNKLCIAIGKSFHEIRHLELIGNCMSNIGLQVILDGCSHLESLDLRNCFYIDLKGNLGKRCSEQIKHLQQPHDSLEGCSYRYENDSETSDYEYEPWNEMSAYDRFYAHAHAVSKPDYTDFYIEYYSL